MFTNIRMNLEVRCFNHAVTNKRIANMKRKRKNNIHILFAGSANYKSNKNDPKTHKYPVQSGHRKCKRYKTFVTIPLRTVCCYVGGTLYIVVRRNCVVVRVHPDTSFKVHSNRLRQIGRFR
jgi:hypothetical protein